MSSPIQTPESAIFVQPTRPDLSKTALLSLLAFTAVSLVLALLFGKQLLPGSPLGQSAAIAGALLLLVPLLFFIVKRGGYTQNRYCQLK